MYKGLLQNKRWGEKYTPLNVDELVNIFPASEPKNEVPLREYMEKNYERNKNFDKDKTPLGFSNKILTELTKNVSFEQVEIEKAIMERFSKRLSTYLNNADSEMFRRLRHKEYLASTIVAFGLEEF